MVNEKLVGVGVVAGLTLLPFAFANAIPGDEIVIAFIICIGAIVLLETGQGRVSMGPAEVEV